MFQLFQCFQFPWHASYRHWFKQKEQVVHLSSSFEFHGSPHKTITLVSIAFSPSLCFTKMTNLDLYLTLKLFFFKEFLCHRMTWHSYQHLHRYSQLRILWLPEVLFKLSELFDFQYQLLWAKLERSWFLFHRSRLTKYHRNLNFKVHSSHECLL